MKPINVNWIVKLYNYHREKVDIIEYERDAAGITEAGITETVVQT